MTLSYFVINPACLLSIDESSKATEWRIVAIVRPGLQGKDPIENNKVSYHNKQASVTNHCYDKNIMSCGVKE